MKPGTDEKIVNAVMRHVGACGPSTFGSILAYVRVQVDETAQDWDVADALNKLIRIGKVSLYDTGDAFI